MLSTLSWWNWAFEQMTYHFDGSSYRLSPVLESFLDRSEEFFEVLRSSAVYSEKREGLLLKLNGEGKVIDGGGGGGGRETRGHDFL
jgi:hypothetical protein